MHAIAAYDNTSSNQIIQITRHSLRCLVIIPLEMYIMFLQHVNYLPGDEDIHTQGQKRLSLFTPIVTPTCLAKSSSIQFSNQIGFHIPKMCGPELFDINGRLIDTWVNGIQYAEGIIYTPSVV